MRNKLNNLDPAAMTASEVAYLGSFIREPGIRREKDFFANRSVVMQAKDMHDELSVAVLAGIIRLYHTNEVTSIDNLAHIMMTEGLVTPDTPGIAGEAQSWTALIGLLNYYAERGAKTLKDFRIRERAVQENWRSERLGVRYIEGVVDDAIKAGGSSFDAAMALRNYADSLVSDSEMAAVTTNWDRQKEFLTEFPDQQKALIGKPRFTFPPHWNLNRLIPVIKPGVKIVLSGGTGDGKSAMAMQFAEWAAICGKNVLIIHMEDREDIILMRQTVRWIGGSLEELERGDPRGRMNQMIKLREEWAKNGGSLLYKYLAGNSIPLIVEQIKETAREYEVQDKHLDLVVMDYFQKADHESQIANGQNYVNAANKGAEMLKIIAEKLSLTMCVISQETPDGNGGKHTEWSRALEKKPQIYISLTRQEIKKIDDEEFVYKLNPATGKNMRVPIAMVGDRSCWVEVQVKKANQSRQGKVWLFFEGPRFRAFDTKFMMEVEDGQRDEFLVPVLQAPTEEFLRKQDDSADAYKRAYRELKDPETRKREKAQAAAAQADKDNN